MILIKTKAKRLINHLLNHDHHHCKAVLNMGIYGYLIQDERHNEEHTSLVKKLIL